MPDKGLGYGLLRYLNAADGGCSLRALPAPQLGFNYLGRFAASAAARTGRGAGEAVRLWRRRSGDAAGACIEVNALTLDGREGATVDGAPGPGRRRC